MIYTMKFFWNGVKVNGVNKIIPVKAYADDNGARILYNWEWSKEFYADLLEIVDHEYKQPEYWGDDGETILRIAKEHPLFKCFKFLADAYDDHYVSRYRQGKGKLKCNGVAHMIADEKKMEAARRFIVDLNAAKKAAEQAEREADEQRRKALFARQSAEKGFIIGMQQQFPIVDGAPIVRICWSEHPAFYDWKDDELTLSLRAADLVFTKLDERDEDGGYYKTKFKIEENGEATYEGRYDLGDEEGGLFKHILNFANTYKDENAAAYQSRIEYLNRLLSFVETKQKQPEIVGVKFSAALPLMIALFKAMKDDDNNEKEG